MEVKDFILSKIREKGVYDDLSKPFLSADLMDSFDYIEMITAVEANYGVMLDLSDYDLDDIITAEGLIEVVLKALDDE